MELKFNKNENAGSWVAEFEATADFNLHIEGVIARNVSVLQKTAGGKYDVVHDLPANAPLDKVIDYDFTALIYPKTIKVVCKDEPTYAEVISEGEIVEMKFQEKVVDVTANGSTVVTPDAGFTGLSKVSVKVDVPSSGGGEGGGDTPSGENNYIYSNYKNISLSYRHVWQFASLIKVEVDGTVFIAPQFFLTEMVEDFTSYIVAVCIDPNLRIVSPEGDMTISDALGGGMEELNWQSITKEEFYTI